MGERRAAAEKRAPQPDDDDDDDDDAENESRERARQRGKRETDETTEQFLAVGDDRAGDTGGDAPREREGGRVRRTFAAPPRRRNVARTGRTREIRSCHSLVDEVPNP